MGSKGGPTLTISETAILLGISYALCEKALKNGEIPAQRMETRWVISRRAVEVFLETGRWPQPNPSAAEIAELVVAELQRIRRAGVDAQMAAEAAAADEDSRATSVLISLRRAG